MSNWQPTRPPVNRFEQRVVRYAAAAMAKPLLDRKLDDVLNYYPCGTWPLNWVMLNWRLRMMTIGEVIRLTEDELLEMRGVGRKTVAKLKEFLADNDLWLRQCDVDDLIDHEILREPCLPNIAHGLCSVAFHQTK